MCNTQRQMHEFIDRYGAEIDLSYVIYHKIITNVIILLKHVNSDQNFILHFPLIQNS